MQSFLPIACFSGRARRCAALLALLLSPFTAGCADEDGVSTSEQPLQGERYTKRALTAELQAVQIAAESPGAMAEVATDRETWRARVGSNDPSASAPLPWDGQFRIASASKPFTAVVLLQLVEEGRLALSDVVEKWLPGVVRGQGNDGTRITLHQLLQHTSGLFDYVADPELGSLLGSAASFRAHRFDALAPAELVALALRHPPLFAPGESFGYSGTNYVLLGMVIEAATGRSWRDQVEHRIVAPLGLTQTYIPGYGPFLMGAHVRGYMGFADVEEPVDVTYNSLVNAADGGIVSTLSDLNVFFRALVRGELLTPELLAQMQQTVEVNDPAFPGGRYGLGLLWSPLSCGGGYWQHAGDTLGFSTRNGVTTDGGRSVALVINTAVDPESTHSSVGALIDHALCAAD
jgi:D-alanyl-D-alanine carboxypeptidase